jgi:methyltransferase
MFSAVLLVVAFLPMLVEARIAARHDRVLRERGAVEPAGDVYRIMQVAYPAAFLAMTIEGWIRGGGPGAVAASGAVMFAAAKLLKYWAIGTLGGRWTFRVLVPPASSRILDGPYRVMRHPNYVAVIGELAGLALMAGATIAGSTAVLVFVLLILKRIRIEERAIGVRPE